MFEILYFWMSTLKKQEIWVPVDLFKNVNPIYTYKKMMFQKSSICNTICEKGRNIHTCKLILGY